MPWKEIQKESVKAAQLYYYRRWSWRKADEAEEMPRPSDGFGDFRCGVRKLMGITTHTYI